jgi:CBS domain-containing protein
MKSFSKPLLSLTAADLMSPLVISIPRQMSVQGAAHLLALNHISGAPVVDDDGRCVGVVSATDFVFLAEGERRSAPHRTPQVNYGYEWAASPTCDDSAPERAAADTVEQLMTRQPVTAALSTRIGELGQKMVDAHIHRIIIVDDRCRPVGVISSTDVLAAVAQADRLKAESRETKEQPEPVRV